MKRNRKIANILFYLSIAVYALTTIYFLTVYIQNYLDGCNKVGESNPWAGLLVVVIVYMIVGTIAYSLEFVLNLIALILANVKSGENKFYGIRFIVMGLAGFLTEALIYLITNLCIVP